jgi:uncharacterized membrane protein
VARADGGGDVAEAPVGQTVRGDVGHDPIQQDRTSIHSPMVGACTTWYTRAMLFENTIDIDAPVDRVWALTFNVESWPAITPTVTTVERLDNGPLRPASTARVKQPGQRARVWTVTAVEPDRRFDWQTRLVGTVMTGRHTLTANGTGTTNTLELDMTGPASGLLGRLVGRQIAKALATENAGFKRAAEA